MEVAAGVRATHSPLAQRAVRLLRTTSINHVESLRTRLERGQACLFGQANGLKSSLTQNSSLPVRRHAMEALWPSQDGDEPGQTPDEQFEGVLTQARAVEVLRIFRESTPPP